MHRYDGHHAQRLEIADKRARIAETNAGSIRAGDVLAQGFAGMSVYRAEHDGTTTTLRTYSLQTGKPQRLDYPVTQMVEIVHPEDHGRELPVTF